MSNPSEFSISRTFDAPRELVWKAFTEAEHLVHWWGPKGFPVFSSGMDFRPGGFFHYGMRSAGGQVMWGKFFYREIVEPEKVVFVSCFSDEQGGITRAPFFDGKWPLEVLNTLTLTEENGKTTMSIVGHPIDATEIEENQFEANRDSMRAGFTGTFEQLEAYLAQLQSQD